MGMSNRKGTEILLNTFKRYRLHDFGAKLVVHTQKSIANLITEEEARAYGIEVICKSVPAPGLYNLGDVYVYPAKLDGLGLTMYEALACGMPVIATDVPPMNEVINSQNGRLVKVKEMHARSDGYYWPLAIVDEESLKEAMMYYINNVDKIHEFSASAREYAERNLDLSDRKSTLLDFLEGVNRIDTTAFCNQWKLQNASMIKSSRNHLIVSLLPGQVESFIRNQIEQRRKK